MGTHLAVMVFPVHFLNHGCSQRNLQRPTYTLALSHGTVINDHLPNLPLSRLHTPPQSFILGYQRLPGPRYYPPVVFLPYPAGYLAASSIDHVAIRTFPVADRRCGESQHVQARGPSSSQVRTNLPVSAKS